MYTVPTSMTAICSLSRVACFSVVFCLISIATTANAQTDGFTTPFRQIELSSDESGAIAKTFVEEGQSVAMGEKIAQLDTRVQRLQVEIAQQLVDSTSEIRATEQMFEQRKQIWNRIQNLRETGHATNGELIRSQMELSIAESKFLAAQEDHVVRQLELRRAQAMLARRTITAPFDGVVAKIHRREGEFLSPLHPEILTLVQVNRLFATFAIPSSQVRQFQIGKEFKIDMSNGQSVNATVYSVSVQTDAKSGTVEIKLVINNPGLDLRSGEGCTLRI